MSAHNKMAEIVEYVSGKFPSIALDKKWNRLVNDMSKEIEILEDATQQSVHGTGGESAANLSLFPAEVATPAKVTRKSPRQ